MRQSVAIASFSFALFLGWPAPTVLAQIPQTFTNLQVLPKDIPRAQLVATMRGFAGALGGRCTHCHVGPDNLQGMDFAIDEKGTKKVARTTLPDVLRLNATMFPKSAMVQIHLGDTAAQKGELPLAESYYERAIEIDPANAFAAKSLETVRARMKKQ